MPAPGVLESRKLQRHLQARWWEMTKGQVMRLRSGNVRGEAFQVEAGPDPGEIPFEIVTDPRHGAQGDGSIQTDAFLSARDRLKNKGGGILFVPAGRYQVDPLEMHADEPLFVLGAGIDATVIELADSAVDGGVFDFDEDTAGSGSHDMGIAGLTIDGRKSNQDGSGQHVGIRCVRVERFLADGVRVHSNDGYNIGLVGSSHPNRSDQTVQNAWLHDGNYDGLDIKSDDPDSATEWLKRVNLHNISSWNHGGGSDSTRDRNGIDIRGESVNCSGLKAWGNETHQVQGRANLKDLTIHGGFADGQANGNRGFSLNGIRMYVFGLAARDCGDGIAVGGTGAAVVGSRGEGCSTNGAFCNGEQTRFTGCEFRNNAANGIQFDGNGSACPITGCIITGNDTGIRWSNTPAATIFHGNDLTGNTTAATNGIPTGTASAANLT